MLIYLFNTFPKEILFYRSEIIDKSLCLLKIVYEYTSQKG